jgi:hypothetical protein
LIEQHVAAVVFAVAVGVGEDDRATERGVFLAGVEVGHAAAHLDDPAAAVGRERERVDAQTRR